MVCVIRSKGTPKRGFLNLSPEANQRATEYLRSVGWDVDRIKPLIWPEDAVSAYRDHPYDPWKFVTKLDVKQRRQREAKEVLWYKRNDGVIKRRAAYVWVFWCPGISGIFFRGWYIYVIGNGFDWSGKLSSKLGKRILELFPFVEPVLFGTPNEKKWMGGFVKRFKKGKWGGRWQGKTPVWVEVKGCNITKIIERVEWPRKSA